MLKADFGLQTMYLCTEYCFFVAFFRGGFGGLLFCRESFDDFVAAVDFGVVAVASLLPLPLAGFVFDIIDVGGDSQKGDQLTVDPNARLIFRVCVIGAFVRRLCVSICATFRRTWNTSGCVTSCRDRCCRKGVRGE